MNDLSKEEALQEYDRLFANEANNIINAFANLETLLGLLKTAGYSQTESITKMSNDAAKLGLKGFSQASIYRMLPEEIKGPTKPGPRKNKLSNDNLSKSRASNARLVLDDEEPKIPPPEQPIIEAQQQEPEKELVHKTLRISMSAHKLSGLSKAMRSKIDEYGLDVNYVIEYDYVDKELYIDLTEKWETQLMVND